MTVHIEFSIKVQAMIDCEEVWLEKKTILILRDFSHP